MRVLVAVILSVVACAATVGGGHGGAVDDGGPEAGHAVLAALVRSLPDTPAPDPPVYVGPVVTIFLASAGITNNPPVEERDTVFVAGRETFDVPTHPARIAWYPRFGRPGFRGANSLFAAHINYVNYGNGPFAYVTSAVAGDTLVVRMENGTEYEYAVKSVEVIDLDVIDMDAIVFPGLDSHTERVTLISCGGTFVPAPGGIGGEYNSRVILVAERYIP